MARKAKDKGGSTTDPVAALMALILERGWRDTTLTDVAERAGMPLAELHSHYRSKSALLDAFAARMDAAVLAGGATEPDASPRDRLFEAVMRRFDAMRPWREALAALSREAPRDPALSLGFACGGLRRGLDVLLVAAGLDDAGWRGMVRRKGIALIYLDALRAFLKDESEDLARTMAVLDRRLRQAEEFINSFRRFRPSSGAGAAR